MPALPITAGQSLPASQRRSQRRLAPLPGKHEMTSDTFHVDGEVVRCDRGGFYRVRLDNGHEVLTRASGKMFISKIRIVLGDRVTVEMNGYSLDRGRIIYRDKA